jgi:uncharacterized protein YbcI
MINQHSQNGTRGQLERTLSQQLQKLYKEQLGHSTGKVSCRLFDNKLMVIVEGFPDPTGAVAAGKW